MGQAAVLFGEVGLLHLCLVGLLGCSHAAPRADRGRLPDRSPATPVADAAARQDPVARPRPLAGRPAIQIPEAVSPALQFYWPALEGSRVQPHLALADTELGRLLGVTTDQGVCGGLAKPDGAHRVARAPENLRKYARGWCAFWSGDPAALDLIAESALFDVGGVRKAVTADVLSLVALAQPARDSIAWLAARGLAGPEELDVVAAHYANRGKYADAIAIANEIAMMQPSPREATACERAMVRARLRATEAAFDEASELVERWEPTSVSSRLSCAARLQAIRCQASIGRAAQLHVPLWTDVIGSCKGALGSGSDAATVALVAAAASWPTRATDVADASEWQAEAALAAHGLPAQAAAELAITALENLARVTSCAQLGADVSNVVQAIGDSAGLSDAQRDRLRRLSDHPSALCGVVQPAGGGPCSGS